MSRGDGHLHSSRKAWAANIDVGPVWCGIGVREVESTMRTYIMSADVDMSEEAVLQATQQDISDGLQMELPEGPVELHALLAETAPETTHPAKHEVAIKPPAAGAATLDMTPEP